MVESRNGSLGKGLIDPCPLWDEDGRAYVAHAYAGSRAGIKSILAVFEMNAEGTKAITPSRTIYDGHADDPTIEGAKFHKRNGEYYIFAPAGGVATGWQVADEIQKRLWPFTSEKWCWRKEKRPLILTASGRAWVDTPEGKIGFFIFRTKGLMDVSFIFNR